jgi:hypothetical protein
MGAACVRVRTGNDALSGTAAERLTIDQVIRDYADVCEAVINLAFEASVAISVYEFRTFNRYLDDAIAGDGNRVRWIYA